MDLVAILKFYFQLSYQTKTKNKIKIFYSPHVDITWGVSQRWILGSILFSKNICDMFFEKYKCNSASYADDNKPHTSDSHLCTVLMWINQ